VLRNYDEVDPLFKTSDGDVLTKSPDLGADLDTALQTALDQNERRGKHS
jgi:hypothetical protein